MRKWIATALIFGLALLFFFNFYGFLKKKVLTSEFKVLTENKLSQLLKANVKIGRIRFGLLKHVSLSGLEINQGKSKLPVQIGIERIVIKYDLLDFLSQKFKVPAEVLLDSPSVNFKSFMSPFAALGSFGFESKNSVFRRIEMDNGELQFQFPKLGQTIDVKKIHGKASLASDGNFNLAFKGELSGSAAGVVEVHGVVRPETKAGKIELQLDQVHFLPASRIPVSEMSGKVEVSESKIAIEELHFKLRGFPLAVSGEIENVFTPYPKWNLSLKLFKEEKPFRLDVKGDLENQSMEGKMDFLGRLYQFTGSLTADQTGFQLDDIVFDNGYEAYGIFDLKEGHYLIKAEREKQRFSFDLDLSRLNVILDFNLNHLPFFGHDLTTFARLTMDPVESRVQLGDYRFRASIKTDYFIFDFHPLRDFQAEFQISESGVDQLTAHWGNASHLKGSVTFGKAVSIDGMMTIDQFKLEELKYLGAHPMPMSLEGALEGKMRVFGEVERPDISGQLSVHDGKIGDFKYDAATIDFYGEPPYFKLLDSKIMRKDNTFLIKGDIDFTLENIFQKVKIVSVDQIVIWKGLDVSSEIKTRAEARAKDPNALNVPAPINAATSGPGSKKVEAEYTIEKGKSLKVVAEEEEGGQQIVTVGPKLRF